MGPRKGGGRAGFLKGSRRPPSEDAAEEPPAAPAAPAPPSQEAAAEPAPATAAVSKKASAFLKDAAPEPAAPAPAVSAKASAFLKDASDDEDGDSDGGGGAAITGEPRGHLLQRHKREAKALKEQAKRLGKKGKVREACLPRMALLLGRRAWPAVPAAPSLWAYGAPPRRSLFWGPNSIQLNPLLQLYGGLPRSRRRRC